MIKDRGTVSARTFLPSPSHSHWMRCSFALSLVLAFAGVGRSAAAPQHPASPRRLAFGEHRIDYHGAEIKTARNGELRVVLKTSRGQIVGRYHPARAGLGNPQGVIWVSGAGGGLDGPARLYPQASERLQRVGVASVRLDYRNPRDFPGCVLDALCGVAFLADEGISRVALVGHSFGGAVVICAGASSPRVRAVVAMASQTYGALQMGPYVAPRPLLLIHGTTDKVLPIANSRKIFSAANEPKQLKLYGGADHGLAHARQDILAFLPRWIAEQLSRPRS